QSAAMPVVPPPSRDRGRRAPAGDAGRPVAPGTGILEFTRVRERTVLTRAFASSPLKVLNPGHAGSSAWAYLASYGGGLVGGDTVQVEVAVGRGAAALLATQASTKVYRSPLGASQHVRAHVAECALL